MLTAPLGFMPFIQLTQSSSLSSFNPPTVSSKFRFSLFISLSSASFPFMPHFLALFLPPTLFIEVEVLQALVQVAGSGGSSDVGVGVD